MNDRSEAASTKPGAQVGQTAARHLETAGERLFAAVLAERNRWALWLPVAIGIGVAIYFQLRFEPAVWIGLVAIFVLLAAWILVRRQTWLLLPCLLLGAAAAGFTMAQVRTLLVAEPVLQGRIGPVKVLGRLVEADIRDSGWRVVLDSVRIETREAVPENDIPKRVRLRIHDPGPGLDTGRWLSVRAVLLPPPPPVAPGAFDFQRQVYFAGIGAVGYAVGKLRGESPAADIAAGGWTLWVEAARQGISARVLGALDGETGAVATALMTGKHSAISKDVIQAMRDSGLAHLLAISGLHIGLVAGLAFFAVHAVCALIPPLVLRYPIKKWAAVAALLVAFAYLLLSGATVPTQRAFLMIGLMLVAVLLDRTAITMRPVAWAAAVILLATPESMMSASFQMSFAAVVGLVAGYELLRRYAGDWRFREDSRWGRWARMPMVYLAGVAVTTVIAVTATSPFAIYHFNRIAAFGLAANLVAVPMTALWIMPWGLLAFLLMPFGLEQGALVPMGWGIDVVIETARRVAAWPGAVVPVPVLPVA